MHNNKQLFSIFSFYQDLGIDLVYSNVLLNLRSTFQEKSKKVCEDKPYNTKLGNQIMPQKNILGSSRCAEQSVLDKISIDLNYIDNVSTLRDYLKDFKGCKLQKTALNTVLGCGNENAKLMLIGEAPGAEEDEGGEPFIGRSGKLLMQAFKSIGMKREDMFITNTVFWRPPGNRVPDSEEINICYPFLHKLISLINPSFIVAVGRSSASVVLNTEDTIGKLRGKWFLSNNIKAKNNLSLPSNINITTVYHPAYLLRSYTQKAIFWDDLIQIKLKLFHQN